MLPRVQELSGCGNAIGAAGPNLYILLGPAGVDNCEAVCRRKMPDRPTWHLVGLKRNLDASGIGLRAVSPCHRHISYRSPREPDRANHHKANGSYDYENADHDLIEAASIELSRKARSDKSATGTTVNRRTPAAKYFIRVLLTTLGGCEQPSSMTPGSAALPARFANLQVNLPASWPARVSHQIRIRAGSYFEAFFFFRDPYFTERCSALANESLSFFSFMRSLACIPASL